MAAPLLAKAGAALKGGAAAKGGAATRSFGGSLMHSSDASFRKLGSKMLKVKDKDVAKHLDTTINTMSKINKWVGKIYGIMAKHSPALQQQMVVMGKAISLFLRPIGDIMARWMAPAARWLIKVAMKWYKMLGGGKGDHDKEDRAEQLNAQADMWESWGDDEMAEKLRAEADGLTESVGKVYTFFDAIKAAGDAIGTWDIWTSEWWTKMFDGVKEFWNNLPENLSKWLTNAKEWWDDLPIKLATWLLNPEQWWNELPDKFSKWLTAPERWWHDLPTKLATWLVKAKEWWNNLPLKLAEAFKKGAEGLNNWGSKVWSLIKSAAGRLLSGKGKDNESKAVGGDIRTTGLYKLHAGERVIRAGEVSNTKGKSNVVINNTFNISASINNDMDIRNLSSRLAEYNESELRRRVSYG